jgi:N-hydroxyarylamine O-acetyltransferase
LSLTSALRLVRDVEQPTAHEPRRLVAEGQWDGLVRRGPEARLFHQARLGVEWHDVCEFTLEEMPPIDRDVGNWYTSTHPGSHFRDRLIVARATPAGHINLVNRELTRRGREGIIERRELQTPDELLAVLAADFDVHFPPGTRFSCPGLDWPES